MEYQILQKDMRPQCPFSGYPPIPPGKAIDSAETALCGEMISEAKYVILDDSSVWVYSRAGLDPAALAIYGQTCVFLIGLLTGIALSTSVWKARKRTQRPKVVIPAPVVQEQPIDIPSSINEPDVIAAIERLRKAREENKCH